MKKVELTVSSLAPVPGSQYVLVLAEKDGFRRIPIVIGIEEAKSIGMALEEITPLRPFTHDLFMNTLLAFGIVLKEIIITKVDENGIFYSELVCEHTEKKIVLRIDSRTSDAVSMALRFDCPIYCNEEVLRIASFNIRDFKTEDKKEEKETAETIKVRIANLEKRLNKAIEEEKYELASRLKKQIDKLKDDLKNFDN